MPELFPAPGGSLAAICQGGTQQLGAAFLQLSDQTPKITAVTA